MNKIIIGIHGLGNKPASTILRKWWISSIKEGLAASGHNSDSIPFELAYWANLLHPEPLDLAVKDKGHPLYIEDPYLPIDQIEKFDPPGNKRKKILDYLGDQLERIFLNDDLTINFSSVSDYIINHFFSDLAAYYKTSHSDQDVTTEHKKEEIRAVLKETLVRHRKKEIILIAHSMGGIIAYDVLSEMNSKTRIHTFVTIGCPLGVPIIRSKISAEHSETDNPKERLKTPETITNNWFNLADLRDKIALYYKLADDFLPNSAGVQVIDKTIINTYRQPDGEKNPHKAYGYLRTAELGEILSIFLEESSQSLFQNLRARIRNWFVR